MGPVNYKEQVRQLYKRAVAEALEGAAEIKAEYADKILALIEEGGTDAIVLAEVEVQIPLWAGSLTEALSLSRMLRKRATPRRRPRKKRHRIRRNKPRRFPTGLIQKRSKRRQTVPFI